MFIQRVDMCCVVKILNSGDMLYDTLRDVPPSVNMRVDVYD